MSADTRSAKFWRAGLAALVALLGVGVYAATPRSHRTSEQGPVEAPARDGQLVNALGAQHLEKFAVVDMADAVVRVSGAQAAGH